MKKLNLLDKLIYILNTVAAIALLFSYLLPHISPETVPIFAILSLFVPFLIIINIVFAIYWIFKLKKQAILSILILAIGWSFNSSIYKFSSDNEDSSKEPITVLSYNVRMFNHWKWIDNDSVSYKIVQFLKHKNADVISLQEFYKQSDVVLNYPHKYIKTRKASENFGLAIYSKFPIVNQGSLDLKNTSNNIIFVDIVKNLDTIRVYNLHLQSLQLNTAKENFGEENSEKLIARLKENFTKQAQQTTVFLEHEKDWNGKKIITGDFNNTSYSWVYNEIIEDKKDAFLEAGKGFGKTFDYWLPMRIDFILADDNALINNFESFTQEKNSDHYPIQAKISW